MRNKREVSIAADDWRYAVLFLLAEALLMIVVAELLPETLRRNVAESLSQQCEPQPEPQ